ncbi:phosphatidate cytidylyltransferase [Sporanaerobium hydrogeniformans]|uniref:Phosphatidate cytidylyltransferase n=1 Tax=Sporanaerobium hydrogeniformans TaxID=3072179 RepID=A0AC61DEZ5_9FIRM|nr:phosphatidate cytidylyltransferase [Sporanaerobium hydrogeniformans]PHV71775.1 phosphatidate cytidylyltransferase [Sporanaerobium hydrogeniformans]
MLTRILTSLVGIPLVVALILLGGPILRYTMLTISCIGLYELYHVLGKKHKPLVEVGYSVTILFFIFLSFWMEHYLIYIALTAIILLVYMVIFYPKYNLTDVALTLFSVVYVGLLFSFIVLITDLKYGAFWIWLIVLSSWGSDTFAYFTGVLCGKHKLAPKLSPKKTIEGSIGGVIGAGVLGYIYAVIYTHYFFIELRSLAYLSVGIVVLGAILSQFGDLAASAIKRFFEQKDFGYILPGHGGILDRFDSFLFVSPLIYVVAFFAEKIIG